MSTRSGNGVRDLYHEVRGLPADARDEFLEQVCGGDRRLRHEVERLLLADQAVRPADTPTLPGAPRR